MPEKKREPKKTSTEKQGAAKPRSASGAKEPAKGKSAPAKTGKAPAVVTSTSKPSRPAKKTAATRKTVAVAGAKKQSPASGTPAGKKDEKKSAAEKTAARAKQALSGRGKLIAAAVGVATAAAAGLAAFKTAAGRKRTVFHLMPHEDGWQVKRADKDKPAVVREKKSDARDEARSLANDNEPSQLVIHRADGTIQTVHTYGE